MGTLLAPRPPPLAYYLLVLLAASCVYFNVFSYLLLQDSAPSLYGLQQAHKTFYDPKIV